MDAEMLSASFGRRIRYLRRRRGLTQEQLAELSEVSPEYISKIERGAASPSFTVIALIARALRVQPVDLFDFSGLQDV